GDYDWFLRVLTQGDLVTRRIERTIASYQMGGVSNRLRPSQAEVYAIQNALPLYRRSDWLKRRVRVFQRDLVMQARRRGYTALLGAIFSYIGVSVVAGFAPRAWLERRVVELQQKVLEGRMANGEAADSISPGA